MTRAARRLIFVLEVDFPVKMRFRSWVRLMRRVSAGLPGPGVDPWGEGQTGGRSTSGRWGQCERGEQAASSLWCQGSGVGDADFAFALAADEAGGGVPQLVAQGLGLTLVRAVQAQQP